MSSNAPSMTRFTVRRALGTRSVWRHGAPTTARAVVAAARMVLALGPGRETRSRGNDRAQRRLTAAIVGGRVEREA